MEVCLYANGANLERIQPATDAVCDDAATARYGLNGGNGIERNDTLVFTLVILSEAKDLLLFAEFAT